MNSKLDWKDAKLYYLGNTQVAVLKARKTDPVRYYGEIHIDDSYHASFGSKLPTSWLVAASVFVRRFWL